MLTAPNLAQLDWLAHGLGQRDSICPGFVTTLTQIHSNIVIEATGKGGDRIAEGDALVSIQPGLTVGVRTADCVPILLVDRRTRAVATIHAGWRGSAGKIVTATVEMLTSKYGSKPEELSAAIGPSIGACCYEVGCDVARRFGEWLPDLAAINRPVHLNLAYINELQLRAGGVQDIWTAGACTFCQADRYFSFRREKEQAGRMLSWIGTTL